MVEKLCICVTGEGDVIRPRLSGGVENLFFSPNINYTHLTRAKDKLFERIQEIDPDVSKWILLTEREFTKRHKKNLTADRSSLAISERIGEYSMQYLFAMKSEGDVFTDTQEILR